jgi:hypothetical protein
MLVLAGCAKDNPVAPADTNTGGGLGGIGGGGTGGGTVTWTISQKPGDNGGIMFTATPGTSVTVTQVNISVPAHNFEDNLQGDGQTVYEGGQSYEVNEYTGVAPGQQWVFRFQGKIGNDQGKDYDVTSNYTVK